MPETLKTLAGKSLVFKFCGGPEDGESLRFDGPHRLGGAAHVLWTTTRMGSVGARFHWYAADASLTYEITGKEELPLSVTVNCEYVESK